MKRQRGRGRKPGGGHHPNQGGHHPNRTLESNGPDTKVRGPAAHIYERYLQLARDAASSGDRVLSENYLQHADHYFRLVRSMQPATPVQPQPTFSESAEFEGDEEGAPEVEAAEESEARGEGDEQPDVEFAQQGQRQRDERGEGDGGRRRGRNRRRFRPDGEREGGYEAREGEERRERSEGAEQREPRRERQPREEGREGFSDGPKPAFLRGGGE
jgi:hypothetical protein